MASRDILSANRRWGWAAAVGAIMVTALVSLVAPHGQRVTSSDGTVQVVAAGQPELAPKAAEQTMATTVPTAGDGFAGAPLAPIERAEADGAWVTPVPPLDEAGLSSLLRGSPDRTAPPTTANDGFGGAADAAPRDGAALTAP